MKKLYAIVLAFFLVATYSIAQDVVLINTDFSEINPAITNHANNSNNPEGSGTNVVYAINYGDFFFKGARYNDTGTKAQIDIPDGEGGNVRTVMDPVIDPSVRYLRLGSNVVLTSGIPTNHFFQVAPENSFVKGGKVTLVISTHSSSTDKGINVYDMSDGTILGTIDIGTITRYAYVTVMFDLPETFSGLKTLGFSRAALSGAIGGDTFYVWQIKVETFKDTPSSIRQPLTNTSLKNVEYYNITGSKMGGDWNILPTGIYIVKKTYDNGEVVTEKVSKARK